MKKLILKGTLLLTLTGFITRLIGFFYRIFLSRTFGAEGMGIYQLVNPILALTFSVCAAGIQTSISKYTAGENATHDYSHSFRILSAGMLLSLTLSGICTVFLLSNAGYIAANVLHESRTEPLIRIIALSIPFASLHSCINGYYYGIQNTKIPAFSQLLEQLIRVGVVYVLYRYSAAHSYTLHISCAVFGMLSGEICSALLCAAIVSVRFKKRIHTPVSFFNASFRRSAKQILHMAVPLSAGRIVINILSSLEAVYIPLQLAAYGLSASDALSVYGILNGMALPFILFPSTLTNSFSVLLLPVISEAQESVNISRIRRAAHKTALCCLLFGGACCITFLCIGNWAGTFFFKNTLAGKFILILSFICPFLYLSTTMSSILHGLGKTGISFLINSSSLLIRLLFVFLMIPRLGIQGYLYGMLFSQLFAASLNYLMVFHEIRKIGKPANYLS